MSELDPSKYNQRLPYGERFTSSPVLSQSDCYKTPDYQDYPDVPEDLYVASDLSLSASDKERLYTSTDGDPLNGYAYGSKARLSLLADEKAATRLGVAHLDKLDPFVVKVLRAQTVLAGFVVRTKVDNASEFLANSGSELYLKQEADQPVGSYKLRGGSI